MINRPEWFEMSTIDYFTIKGKVMFDKSIALDLKAIEVSDIEESV